MPHGTAKKKKKENPVLFILAQNWKLPKPLTTREWMINKLWYSHTRQQYLAIERNELLIHIIPSVDLESIIVSESSRHDDILEKTKPHEQTSHQ